MIKFYRIANGPVRIGPDRYIVQSAEQFVRRGTRMAKLEERDGVVKARPNENLDFKTGEIVGLSVEPLKQFAENFVLVTEKEAAQVWGDLAKKAAERDKLASDAGNARRAAARKTAELRAAKEQAKLDEAAAKDMAALKAKPQKPVAAAKPA